MRHVLFRTAVALLLLPPAAALADPPAGQPAAVVDLMTDAGVARVSGQWRFHEARVVETTFFAPGPDGQPSSAPARTADLEPRAGGAGFDDASWELVPPGDLSRRRGNGRLSFAWYRLRITIPERVGTFDTAGATVVFQTALDDYAEVWVDGELSRALGQQGGSVIAGWNAPNRVILARRARPGQSVQLAVFAANGPLSDAPTNYVWMREARLEFFADGRAPALTGPREVNVEVVRLDPAMDSIVSRNPKVQKLAEGFEFTEGPAWAPDGALLFSDPDANRIYRYVPDETLEVFREQSGYAGPDLAEYRQPGSNGLAFDPAGRLTICEHGRRRVSRLEPDGTVRVLAERDLGRRLNSPNDLVYRADGTLYFTDPFFGLPGFASDPRRELDVCGVYRWSETDGLTLLVDDLTGPNGLALSPDERVLYVGNWDDARKVVMRYDVAADGSLGAGRVFCDLTAEPGEDAIDGVKVDGQGHVWVSGPGGLWVFAPSGRALGRIVTPRHVHNMAWGDADRGTLYLCARDGLYRMRPGVGGARAVAGAVERLDPRLDRLLAPGARLERIAGGFQWIEGPVWSAGESCLYFTDIPANAVYRWREESGAALFLKPSGYSGAAPFEGREPGANGLALDGRNRLVLCEHGDRRISRLEPDGARTVLVDRYRGRRLNSPNDAVYASNGDLYFTDPPFGLPRGFEDGGRELDFSGVYRLGRDGALELLIDDLPGPNGICLSPDERTLYVSNAVRGRQAWMAYDLSEDGSIRASRLLADASVLASGAPGTPDGMAVDVDGNIFTAGPGGVYVFAPDGGHLGTILTGVATSNCTWGDDGSTLYVTASDAVHRIRTLTRGRLPGSQE